jgi:two-component system, NarL family, nitrate/nitrite response regulator NarL
LNETSSAIEADAPEASAFEAALGQSELDARGIGVLIVVGVCLYREGLGRALSAQEGFRLVGSTRNLVEACEAIARLRPDVVLLDPATDPEFAIVELTAEISSETRVVALGVREVEQDVLRCAEAGIAAYVPREASIAELVAVIESAARGELRCSPSIAASLFRRVALLTDSGGPSSPAVLLTPRERQIASLIDEGLSNKQIAQRLQIGVSTVKNHVHNLLKKLNTSRRGVAAARYRGGRGLEVRMAADRG